MGLSSLSPDFFKKNETSHFTTQRVGFKKKLVLSGEKTSTSDQVKLISSLGKVQFSEVAKLSDHKRQALKANLFVVSSGIGDQEFNKSVKVIAKMLNDPVDYEAELILEKLGPELTANSLKQIDPKLHSSLAQKLVETEKGATALVENLDKLKGLKSKEKFTLLKQAVARKGSASKAVAKTYDKVSGLTKSQKAELVDIIQGQREDPSMAALLANGATATIVPKKMHFALLNNAIDFGESSRQAVVGNLQKFTGVKKTDHKNLLVGLLQKGTGSALDALKSIKKFKGVDKQGANHLLRSLLDPIKRLTEGLTNSPLVKDENNHQDLIDLIIDHFPEAADAIPSNIKKFTGVTADRSLARRLEALGKEIADSVKKNIGQFENVSKEEKNLIKKKRSRPSDKKTSKLGLGVLSKLRPSRGVKLTKKEEKTSKVAVAQIQEQQIEAFAKMSAQELAFSIGLITNTKLLPRIYEKMAEDNPIEAYKLFSDLKNFKPKGISLSKAKEIRNRTNFKRLTLADNEETFKALLNFSISEIDFNRRKKIT